jgi:3'(2'), 5'-bisphosphate nucleotidase
MEVEVKLAALLDVIHEADEAIMDVYASPNIEATQKADSTPLTRADLASHQILTEGFSILFPEIPVVSEEGDEALNREVVLENRFWLIDPLDGTREFLARTGYFTVCAALIEDELPTFGIISAPALRQTYYGGPSMGSFRSEYEGGAFVPIHTSRLSTNVILGSRTNMNKATADYINEHYPETTIEAVGSQLKLPRIAEGLADAYPRIDGPLHLWDLAAGHAILVGAGGSVARPDGSPVNYHDSSLLVGDFVAENH